MKKCPYCAEEIQDEAIKCRYCQSWLVSEIPAGAETPPAEVVTPGPTATEPETAAAELAPASAIAAEEAIVPATETGPETVPAPDTATETVPVPETATAEATAPQAKIEFTHSGDRYLLGYTDEFFGIWDRQAPAEPTERFPRTDDGWRDVWQRYVAIERNWMDLRTGQRSQ